MTRLFFIFYFGFLTILSLSSTAFASNYHTLAERWAPLVQVAKQSYEGPLTDKEDIFTVFNYDQDWRGNNNWHNLYYYKIKPAVYYSVVDAEGRYYIGYYFYYPRRSLQQSDYNFSGLILEITQNNHEYGELSKVLVLNKGKYTVIDNIAKDGPVYITSAVENGIAVSKSKKILKDSSSALYKVKTANYSNSAIRNFEYELVCLDNLWEHRGDIEAGKFQGLVGSEFQLQIKESYPWNWQIRQIKLLSDPVNVFAAVTKREIYPRIYIYNPYNSKD